MAYKIFFTEDALTDLETILDYISADNPAAAERFGQALLNHIEVLQNFHRIGLQVETYIDPQNSPLAYSYLLSSSRRQATGRNTALVAWKEKEPAFLEGQHWQVVASG